LSSLLKHPFANSSRRQAIYLCVWLMVKAHTQACVALLLYSIRHSAPIEIFQSLRMIPSLLRAPGKLFWQARQELMMASTTAVQTSSAKWRRNLRRLTRHYLPFSIVTGLVLMFFLKTLPGGDERTQWKWSMATAYAGLALLGFTLLVGAFNVLRSRPNPISSDLTRDAGISATLVSIVHVAVGLFVHMGSPWLYFFYPAGEKYLIPLRYDAFGLANWIGLTSTLILIGLFTTSNDLSLRKLGRGRWKTLQRSNYFLFGFVALHGIAYQILEKRTVPLILLLVLMIGIVVILQLAAFVKRRREKEIC
jgi:methionine sulfoxide reductase heme-binding subunit